MRNKIVKTFIRTTALCMTILAVGTHTGVIVNAKQDVLAFTEHDVPVGTTNFKNLLCPNYSGVYIYGLKDHRTYGVASGNANNDTRIDMEGMYGIRAATDGDELRYSLYRHTAEVQEEATVTLYEV